MQVNLRLAPRVFSSLIRFMSTTQVTEIPAAMESHGETGRESDEKMNLTLTPEMIRDMANLKGDAIGDTLYSERWVLKQLMNVLQCTSGEMSSEVEEELCLLWDMTVGEDVTKFLLKHDFLTIVTQCLKSSAPPRAMEIAVGIFGNMCRTVEARHELAVHGELQAALLDLLSSTDSHILLQLMRLLSTCIWHIDKEDDDTFNNGLRSWLLPNIETFHQQLAFIISSSLNGDLLCCSLELVHNLCCVPNGDGWLSSQIATNAMLTGLFEAACQLISGLEKDCEMKLIWTKDVEKALEHWAMILDLLAQTESGISVLSDNSDDFVSALVCVLSALGEPESTKVLSRHKWQLLGSIVNTLRRLGERTGLTPLAVLPYTLRLIPRLPKLPGEAAHVASFDDDDDDDYEVYEEDKDDFLDVRMNIASYCVAILGGSSAEALLEAFNQTSTINIVELHRLLQISSDEGCQQVAKMLSSVNLTAN